MPNPPSDIQTAAVSSAERDRAEGLIKLDVLVTDAAGKAVAGLKPADFNLLENGRPQKVLSFDSFSGREAGSEPPVKIILMVDTFGPPADPARIERLAVDTYLRQPDPRPGLPVSVYLLQDNGLWTLADPSGNRSELARELEHNNIALVERDMENLNDIPSVSALKALALIAAAERKIPGRKLLFWVGPGWGIGSGCVPRCCSMVFESIGFRCGLLVLRSASGGSPLLHSFTVGEIDPKSQVYRAYLAGVTSRRQASLMNLYRKVLAVERGGRVADKNPDLVEEIKRCVQDGGPFYRISFDPLPARTVSTKSRSEGPG